MIPQAWPSPREGLCLLDAMPEAHDHNNAWRYGVLQIFEARLQIANGDTRKAQSILAAARPVLTERFGNAGFYTLLAQQQEQLLPHAASLVQPGGQPLQTANSLRTPPAIPSHR